MSLFKICLSREIYCAVRMTCGEWQKSLQVKTWERANGQSKGTRPWWIWSAKFGIQKTEKQKNWPYGWIELLLDWGWKFLKKLWCCVGGGNKVIWLYQQSWKCKLATVTSYKADVRNSLWWRANARNVSFITRYGGHFTFSTYAVGLDCRPMLWFETGADCFFLSRFLLFPFLLRLEPKA